MSIPTLPTGAPTTPSVLRPHLRPKDDVLRMIYESWRVGPIPSDLFVTGDGKIARNSPTGRWTELFVAHVLNAHGNPAPVSLHYLWKTLIANPGKHAPSKVYGHNVVSVLELVAEARLKMRWALSEEVNTQAQRAGYASGSIRITQKVALVIIGAPITPNPTPESTVIGELVRMLEDTPARYCQVRTEFLSS